MQIYLIFKEKHTMYNSIFDFPERPLGSQSNNDANLFVENFAEKLNYSVKDIPITVKSWNYSKSKIKIVENEFPIFPSPFSQPVKTKAELIFCETSEELQKKNITGKIVVLFGKICQDPLMPKDFPFYYPQECKDIIDYLESQKPVAVLTLTHKHPICGLCPFPLFEDGNFSVPSAYADSSLINNLIGKEQISAELLIQSENRTVPGSQLIITKTSTNKNAKTIIFTAHIDTKYNTPGAIDNGSGVAVMLKLIELFHNYSGQYNLEFVPFNGEENYAVPGQLEYLKTLNYNNIELVINFDSPGHINSKTAISLYNFDEDEQNNIQPQYIALKEIILNTLQNSDYAEQGIQWFAGDHTMFVMRGIPCLAITSSDLFEKVIDLTHTPDDTIKHIDLNLIERSAEVIYKIITQYSLTTK